MTTERVSLGEGASTISTTSKLGGKSELDRGRHTNLDKHDEAAPAAANWNTKGSRSINLGGRRAEIKMCQPRKAWAEAVLSFGSKKKGTSLEQEAGWEGPQFWGRQVGPTRLMH